MGNDGRGAVFGTCFFMIPQPELHCLVPSLYQFAVMTPALYILAFSRRL